jgi:fatty acid desaturase
MRTCPRPRFPIGVRNPILPVPVVPPWLIGYLLRRRTVLEMLGRGPSMETTTVSAEGPLNDEENAYRRFLKSADFSKEELAAIHATDDGRAVADFFGALATTAAVPWLYWLFPSWITVVICILLSIHNFNALTQIGHASGHGNFLSNARWNAIAGEIACALRGFSRTGFAVCHQLHHAHLNEDEDADRLFGRPEESTRKLVLLSLQDLVMITGAKRLLQYMQTDRRTYDHRPWERLTVRFFTDRVGMMLPIAAAQLLVIAYYWIVIGLEFYAYFYALPLATLYPAQIRLRSACEHSFEVGYDVVSDGRWVSRSTNANAVERFIIGPLCSDYHFEHHLLPAVPYYNMPLVRRLLEKKGLQVPVSSGYVGYLARRWREERTLACINSPAR